MAEFERVGDGFKRQAERDPSSVSEELAEVVEALTFIPACIERGKWLSTIFGVHSEFGGTACDSEALEAVIEWSSTCPAKYAGDDQIGSIWAKAVPDGGTTIASVYALAKENGFVAMTAGEKFRRLMKQEEDGDDADDDHWFGNIPDDDWEPHCGVPPRTIKVKVKNDTDKAQNDDYAAYKRMRQQ